MAILSLDISVAWPLRAAIPPIGQAYMYGDFSRLCGSFRASGSNGLAARRVIRVRIPSTFDFRASVTLFSLAAREYYHIIMPEIVWIILGFGEQRSRSAARDSLACPFDIRFPCFSGSFLTRSAWEMAPNA